MTYTTPIFKQSSLIYFNPLKKEEGGTTFLTTFCTNF